MLICPVCKKPLRFSDRSAGCENNHCFDIAREGYVNLLRGSKSGDFTGDSKQSARSRRDFLNKDYYSSLKDALIRLLKNEKGSLLDICCGEGYYTSAIGEHTALNVYGFDISREMVRLAAKRGNGNFFVANIASIPVADQSIDVATHLFAPFHEKEFARVLKPGGRLFSAVPGKTHLYGLKQAIYNTPYYNDEKLPETKLLQLVSVYRVIEQIILGSQEDIWSVFQMTPYFYRTSDQDKIKLNDYQMLTTDVSFVIAEYVKT